MPQPKYSFEGIILLFLILFMALPAPRESYTILFKLYTLGFVLISIFFVVSSILKGRIFIPKLPLLIPFLFLPLFFAVYGYLRGNDNYYILREFFLFLLPIITFTVIVNITEDLDVNDLIRLIVWAAVLASFYLFAYEVFGLLFEYEKRFQFRYEFVTRNIGFLILGYIFYLYKAKRGIDLFWPGAVVLTASLILSMGRLPALTTIAFALLFLFILGSGLSHKAKCLITIMIVFAPFIYTLWLVQTPAIKTSGDKSELWRKMEAKTVFENIADKKINPLIGNGLGHAVVPFRPILLYRGESLSIIRRFHNFFLYMLTKTGFIGTLIFMISFFFLAKGYYSQAPPDLRNDKLFLLFAYLLFVIFIDAAITGHFTMNVNCGMELGLFLAVFHKISTSKN